MNDKDIIKALRGKAERHRKLSEMYTKAANVIEDEVSVIDKVDNVADSAIHDKVKRTTYTFRTALLEVFKDGVPKTSKELLLDFNALTKKGIKYNSFSGQLSTLMNRTGLIRKHEIVGNPISHRFYYGLKDWFDDNKLKDIYFEKIR